MHVKAAGLRLEGNSGGRSEKNKVQGSCRKVSVEGDLCNWTLWLHVIIFCNISMTFAKIMEI